MDSRILPFLRASVAHIFKRSRELDIARDLGPPPFDLFSFLGLASHTINPHATFEFCIISRSRDIRGSKSLKSRSGDLGHAPF